MSKASAAHPNPTTIMAPGLTVDAILATAQVKKFPSNSISPGWFVDKLQNTSPCLCF
jgi:hypothetical protein